MIARASQEGCSRRNLLIIDRVTRLNKQKVKRKVSRTRQKDTLLLNDHLLNYHVCYEVFVRMRPKNNSFIILRNRCFRNRTISRSLFESLSHKRLVSDYENPVMNHLASLLRYPPLPFIEIDGDENEEGHAPRASLDWIEMQRRLARVFVVPKRVWMRVSTRANAEEPFGRPAFFSRNAKSI